MSSINDRITQLIIRHLDGELTEADRQELEHWMDQSDANRQIGRQFLTDEGLKEGLQNLLSKRRVWEQVQEQTGTGRLVYIKRRSFIRWVAAACIAGLLFTGGYWLFNRG